MVSKARALLSRLQSESQISEHVQIVMIYRLLNSHIKDEVSSGKVNIFKDLFETARAFEISLIENTSVYKNSKDIL